jgi:carboxylate-amine ligase
MIEHAFGERPPLTLGVEEELFVVDAESLEPVAPPAELFDGTRLKAELFRSLVELNTEICATPADVAAELATLRADARTRAAEAGLAVGASGTILFCGAHVHVGVASPEACMEALEFVLPWLPVLLAVSANSPWFERRETGLASTRAELLTLLPRNGSPPVFASYEDWERFVERLVRLGLADSYRRMWWDVRPHPGFGTLEIRIPDQPTDPTVTVALAALVQALVGAGRPGPPADRGVYAQNRWAASRFGPQAPLIHPEQDLLVPARELLAELAARLGVDVSPLLDLDQAAEQLETGRREGLHTLCGSLLAS